MNISSDDMPVASAIVLAYTASGAIEMTSIISDCRKRVALRLDEVWRRGEAHPPLEVVVDVDDFLRSRIGLERR